MVTDHAFLSKVFGVFDFWTFFLSIFEIPKILCPKIFGKKNKLGKQLKEHSVADKYIFLNNLKSIRLPINIYFLKNNLKTYIESIC